MQTLFLLLLVHLFLLLCQQQFSEHQKDAQMSLLPEKAM
jgi:hypothetical protein